MDAHRTDSEGLKDRRKTDDKSTKNGLTHEEQMINVSNTNMYTERKVSFCYKRKEEPEEVMRDYLLPCNANATESYRTKLNANATERNANTTNSDVKK